MIGLGLPLWTAPLTILAGMLFLWNCFLPWSNDYRFMDPDRPLSLFWAIGLFVISVDTILLAIRP